MISKMAKADVEAMISDGLNPSYEDIIRLNALGLKVESGSDAYDFSALPRIAFLGDYILEEPSVYKRYWMDKAELLIEDDYINKLFFYAYALHTPDNGLPELDNIKKLTDSVWEFTEKIIHSTETQILTAIQYVMKGNDHVTDEEFTDEDVKSVVEIPEKLLSAAQQLIGDAIINGFDKESLHLTSPVLLRMITVALIKNGVDVLKTELALTAGKYYACYEEIKNRLMKDKENGEK